MNFVSLTLRNKYRLRVTEDRVLRVFRIEGKEGAEECQKLHNIYDHYCVFCYYYITILVLNYNCTSAMPLVLHLGTI